MLITRDDIRLINNERSLFHFLEEKLNLPIPKGSPLEDITAKFGKQVLRLSAVVANKVLDCQELGVASGEPSGIILIRFNSKSGYTEALRAVAEGLHRRGRNPADLRFICMNKSFQPFAFAYFSDSMSADWNKAVLTIFDWGQNHTRLNTGSEHDLSALFPIGKIDNSDRSKTLLTKLQKIGTRLDKSLGKDEDIHSGIGLTYKKAFVIDDATAEQLIADDPRSEELIKTFPDKYQRWKWESKNIIYIPSSKNKKWPWSDITDEDEAERIFEKEYPAISAHMKDHEDRIKKGKRLTLFYWEFPPYGMFDKLNRRKIIYKSVCNSMQAAYDPPADNDRSCEFLCATTLFIPTTDRSLLAILNSKLFDWYARKRFKSPKKKIKALALAKKNIVKAPIAPRKKKQKDDLSDLVQRIFNDPNSPEVPDIEKEIDALVYELYKLTPAEIALIEEETSQ